MGKNISVLRFAGVGAALLALAFSASVHGTPANRAAFSREYDHFLAKRLNSCTTCHLPSANKNPENLDEFPHNPYGARLRVLGKELSEAGKSREIAVRVALVADEDSDRDGVPNQVEILLGRAPGDVTDTPNARELSQIKDRQESFARFQTSYRWQPFQTPKRPAVPAVKNKGWARNPIDQFIAAEHEDRQLTPRPEAPREILLRRLYLDLIGLAPTRAEVESFLNDPSGNAYEKVIEQLLDDPRYGERWARHWMDVWRYSDWAGWTEGNQIRDSQPHIWRWRDWIVESLNSGKGYDKMMVEMLAADELTPADTNAVRATGFLARNFKLLSREQWMEDTLKHTGQAFLGLTIGCAKCHDHMTDPILQQDYYRLRAIFEPHQVRIDRVPGQTDTAIDGLVRVFDTDTNAPTYLYIRGDEKRAQTNTVLTAAIPQVFNAPLKVEPVALPRLVAYPDKRDSVIRDLVTAREKALASARSALSNAGSGTHPELELKVSVSEAELQSLLAVLAVEKLEDLGEKGTAAWEAAAKNASSLQRKLAFVDARLKVHQTDAAKAKAKIKADETAKALGEAMLVSDADAGEKLKEKKKASEKARKEMEEAEKKFAEAEKALASAEKDFESETTTAYSARPMKKYPASSTGRRLAFARWLASADNPLTARVAVNHIWARHFGRGLAPTVSDFGAAGKPPSHPALLDWLAVEFVEHGWSMKHLHRLILSSSAYRMASSSEEKNAAADPDNIWLWRMNSRRMEAEIVRDNILHVTGNLDPAMGGPEIDAKLALTSKRRSVYLRCAQEKQAEFLQIFDGPSVVECYERKPTVMPQQALALANSDLAIAQAKILAAALSEAAADNNDFIERAFWRVLSRGPNPAELALCNDFLKNESSAPVTELTTGGNDNPASNLWGRQNLVLVLFNHNDFVTIR